MPGRADRSLPSRKVIEIRQRKLRGETYDQLVASTGLARHTLMQIIAGHTYREIGGPIQRRGSRAKLTRELVSEIRQRLKRGESEHDLAPEYGLSVSGIRKIKYNQRWKKAKKDE